MQPQCCPLPRATLLHVHLSAHSSRLLPAPGQSRAAWAAHFQHNQGLQNHFPSVHEGTWGPAVARTQQDSGMINRCPRCDSTVGTQASWQDARQQRVPFSLLPPLGLQRNRVPRSQAKSLAEAAGRRRPHGQLTERPHDCVGAFSPKPPRSPSHPCPPQPQP